MDHEDEPLFDPDEIDQDDIDRYESAAGWNPNALAVEKTDTARDKVPRWNPGAIDTMLETRPAVEWHTRPDSERPELLLDIWHEGEVAAILGPRGSGKSIFSVQLTENLSRGSYLWIPRAGMAGSQSSPPYAAESTGWGLPAPERGVAAGRRPADGVVLSRSSHTTGDPRKILYFDFQRTAAQWTERYSSPRDGARRRRKKYSFSRNFERAAFAWDGDVPDHFKGDLHRYLQHSIVTALEQTEARVIIIDDISYLVPSPTSAALTKIIKTLRLWAATYNLSILVLAQLPKFEIRNSKFEILRSPLADLTDTAFAILPSTFGPNYRYLKHLTSTRPITHDETNVLTLRLKRHETSTWTLDTPRTRRPQSSPPYAAESTGRVVSRPERGVAAASADGVVLSPATENTEPAESRSVRSDSSLIPHPSSIPAGPFLGFEYLGPSEESDHLRDYEAHLKTANRVEERERRRLLKRSSKEILVDAYLDGSYKRYLLGE